MRATRAYMASLGTTGLLVLGAVAILIAGSALLAFEGWPGESGSDDVHPVVIHPGSDETGRSGPERVAQAAGELAGEVALVRVAAAAPGGGQAPSAGGPPAGGPGPEEPGNDTGPDGTPPSSDPPGEPGSPVETPPGTGPQPPDTVTLTDGVADGLESATDFLGDDAVSPLNSGLGSVVTGAGELVTDIVRALDGTPPPARP